MPDLRLDALRGMLGRPPIAAVRAPGRVNLIGDHTDYCEGFVLPMAIDRDCAVAVAPGRVGRIHARSREHDGDVDIAADGTGDPGRVEPPWGRFVAGTAAVLTGLGAVVPPLEVALSSSVPAGSGLSSSSALSVALMSVFRDAAAFPLDGVDLARAALDAEIRATGVPGGLMDQLAAVFGARDHALLIDCRSMHVDPISLPRALGVLVVHSGLPRTLADSPYADRRAACEAAAVDLGVRSLRDATLQQAGNNPRARHVVTENARVLEFADALRAGDVAALGPLLTASHESLRDDFEVSTTELDLLAELLVEHGAYGARLTGAGFGGCVVALVQRNHRDDLAAKVVSSYRSATRLEATAFSVNAVDGADRIDTKRAP